MPLWLIVWTLLVLGALVFLGWLVWRVFVKVKDLLVAVADAAADAGDAGEAATTWHQQWSAERNAADERYQAELRDSARPGPRNPLPGVLDLPPKG